MSGLEPGHQGVILRKSLKSNGSGMSRLEPGHLRVILENFLKQIGNGYEKEGATSGCCYEKMNGMLSHDEVFR